MEEVLNSSTSSNQAEGSSSTKPLEVPMELFKLNRRRLCEKLTTNGVTENVLVFLQGGDELRFYDTELEYVFRQESYFLWTFGVTDPGCFGAIHLPTKSTYLFVPRQTNKHELYYGKLTIEDYKEKYEIENVYYIEEMLNILRSLSFTLLTLNELNSHTGFRRKKISFEGIESFILNEYTLQDHIEECRVFKTDIEKEVMRYVGRISCDGHEMVMKKIRPGMKEYQCDSLFRFYTHFSGRCRHLAYPSICASGADTAIFHYGHASKPHYKVIKNGDMCTFDMGASYYGYCSDITVSFPVNGKFTEDQKSIYNVVLAANLAVQAAMKPGVTWNEMRHLSEKVMLEHLKGIGIVTGDIDEMFEADIAVVFQPHDLGHLLGLDPHDVGEFKYGEYAEPEIDSDGSDGPSKPKYRRKIKPRDIEAGMALTIEPGCYFIDSILDEALQHPVKSSFLNEEVLNRFRGFGGVRIEDNVFVTENGIENYTEVPRTVEEIENLMSSRHRDNISR